MKLQTRRMVSSRIIALAVGVCTGVLAPASRADSTTRAQKAGVAIDNFTAEPAPEIVVPGVGAVSTSNGVKVTVPTDPELGVRMTAPNGSTMSIGLPGAAQAKDAQIIDGASVFVDAFPGATIAVQPLASGGVQALVVVENNSAPHDYAFPLRSRARMNPRSQPSLRLGLETLRVLR
jgi:hypothetical protein